MATSGAGRYKNGQPGSSPETNRNRRRAHASVETRNCHGVPHREIIAYADEVDADAIVMGFEGKAHSKGNIGSVVERVFRDASRPVFAV